MSDFRIKTCVLGPVSTNCYILYRRADGRPWWWTRRTTADILPTNVRSWG